MAQEMKFVYKKDCIPNKLARHEWPTQETLVQCMRKEFCPDKMLFGTSNYNICRQALKGQKPLVEIKLPEE